MIVVMAQMSHGGRFSGAQMSSQYSSIWFSWLHVAVHVVLNFAFGCVVHRKYLIRFLGASRPCIWSVLPMFSNPCSGVPMFFEAS